MIVLGLETSTEVCGVCLLSDSGVLAERSMIEARVHSEKLLTLVREVFLEARIEMHDIAGVSVSIGPGSFTGLRIGLSSAKGLCYSLDKLLVAVSTFDAVIETVVSSKSSASKVAVVLDAKQGEHYIGTYLTQGNKVQSVGKLQVLATAQSARRMRSESVEFIVTDSREVWEKELDKKVQFGSFTEYCRAEAVARLGLKKIHAKDVADLAAVEPMYLKDFVVKAAR
ncbi:MAG: tRNA (adenosine(37)-N6)-threonylcarbamoyltransferase complex dimerization subunit type 1 TsaB [Ignavibacteriae bacterium]|nr:tRNA (adenosine(37)-N6)-threonylcarbamoyltransferase complex dimerization subunit type 1 TsaB [Ignavibacteriota bacterium]